MATQGQVTSDRNSVEVSLRNQLRYEINGAELKNPERFALEQKFGIHDPVLIQSEQQAIAAEGVFLG